MELIEARLTAFEEAWRSGLVPTFAHYLAMDRLLDSSNTRTLLNELIAIDLEYRWSCATDTIKSSDLIGTKPRLLAYVEVIEQLESVTKLNAWTVAEEYRVRQVWGDRPTIDQFLAEYPNHLRELTTLLPIVQKEIAADGVLRSTTSDATLQHVGDSSNSLPFSDFVLEQHLGTGGMGKVYRARQLSIDRTVAIKSLLKARQTSPLAMEQFIREAEIVQQLDHAHIVHVHGTGRFPGGGHFLVMDFVEGADLAVRLKSGPVSFAEAIETTCAVARAISYAHKNGIVHCDLKPSNILRSDLGRIFVTDFGFAQVLNSQSEQSASLGGTLAYMAPERFQLATHRVSAAVDIYGLGAILYNMLTGRAPLQGRDAHELMERLRSGAQPEYVRKWRPDIPNDLEQICLTCLKTVPTDRFASAEEVERSLQNCRP